MAKMFCKMCFDSGKPESEYTSHWVKDAPNGKVVCPTLLNHMCGYCKQKGHTPKHCARLASREERRKIHKSRFQPRFKQAPVERSDKVQQQIHTVARNDLFTKLMITKPSKLLRPPEYSPVTPVQKSASPQGGKVAKVGEIAKNMTAAEVMQLKAMLQRLEILNVPAPFVRTWAAASAEARQAPSAEDEHIEEKAVAPAAEEAPSSSIALPQSCWFPPSVKAWGDE
jgi:hypothetical protein